MEDREVVRIGLVVMGVSGSGKSTVAAALANELDLHFIEGDALHSRHSVSLMRAGISLTDADRWPWLDRVAANLCDVARWPEGVVISCSALKRAYRDRIRNVAAGVRFLFLDGPDAVIEERMARRSGHYMSSSLLASQLQTLERPSTDEQDVLSISIELTPAEIVTRAAYALGA